MLKRMVLTGVVAGMVFQPLAFSEKPTVKFPVEAKATVSKEHLASTEASANAKTVVIPANTVVHVSLAKPLSTKKSEPGEIVTATVQEPLYVGPFLTIPEGAIISGRITEVNKKAQKKGPNPYIIVDFYEVKRPQDNAAFDFKGTLIAYRTGLSGKDYVWRIPTKKGKLKTGLTGALEGAAYGAMVNPIFGTPIGAGVGAVKSLLTQKIASKGSVKVSEKEQIPISVQEEFVLPVIETQTVKQSDSAVPVGASDGEQSDIGPTQSAKQ